MIADYLGWNVVPASGASDFNPGDITNTEWLGECKTHMKPVDKVSFNLSVYKKICTEAMSKMKKPIMFSDKGTQIIHETHVLLPFNALPDFEGRTRKFKISLFHDKVNIHIIGGLLDGFDGYVIDSWADVGNVIIMRLETFKKILDGDDSC